MKREVTSKNSYFGKRAIVVGAGLSGLSVARVLSDHFAEVMIVDSNQVVLIGRGKDIPPVDGNKFLSYARQLPTLTFYHAIKNAKRLTDVMPFFFPKADGDISRRSLTFLAGCFRLGMLFVVSIQFTARG